MKSNRFLATIPRESAEALEQFSAQVGIYASVIVQQAVTATCKKTPTEEDIAYERGDTVGVQLTFSDTAFQLLEMWHKQTNISKSKLVAYSIQETIIKGGSL